MFFNRCTFIASLLLALACNNTASAESNSAEKRTSTSTINGKPVENKHRVIPRPAGDSSKEVTTDKARSIRNFDHGLFVYDLFVNLNTDNDADGYYSTFSITLDLENSFNPRDVYAVFYLSQSNGPWIEYAASGDFTVNGLSANDALFLETSLDVGFSSDYYDLYTEVYDTYTGDLLLSFGPNESSHVIGIPFESNQNDSFYLHEASSVSLQLNFSGSGSLSNTFLLPLLSLFLYRWFRTGKIKTQARITDSQI